MMMMINIDSLALKGDYFQQRYCDEESKAGYRIRRWAREVSFEPDVLRFYRVYDLYRLDRYGWAPIHYAIFNGYTDSAKIILKSVPDLLELRTADKLRSTPLILATMTGQLETVKHLVELGANLSVLNAHCHGVVELCCVKSYTWILRYFISLKRPELPVWRYLVEFLKSDDEVDVWMAAKTLHKMTERVNGDMNPAWRHLYMNGLIAAMARVGKWLG